MPMRYAAFFQSQKTASFLSIEEDEARKALSLAGFILQIRTGAAPLP